MQYEGIEIFKPVPGFDNYIISNWGVAKSKDWEYIRSDGRRYFRNGRILKQTLDIKRYPRVTLVKNKKSYFYAVHRLMALAFLDNPFNYDTVDHKDECKTHNFIYISLDGTVNPEKSNLQWLPNRENIARGTRAIRSAQSHINNPLISTPILSFDKKDMTFKEEFPSLAEAGRAGFNYRNIHQCLTGKRKSSGGRIWKRKEAPETEASI